MSKVTVTADALGNVINESSNPEFGYFRVESTTPTFNGKFVRFSKRSALIAGRIEDLKAMGLTKGLQLPGKIVIKEGLEPINPNNVEQGLKRAGEDGMVCTYQDQPIYRDQVYTPDENAQDVLIAHDNGDAIREAQAIKKAEDSLVED